MKMRMILWAAALGGMLVCGSAMAAADNGAAAGPALAFRLESMAHDALTPVQLGDVAANVPYLRQAAALLEAAHRCDPGEPRYLVLLNEALDGLGDVEAQRRTLIALTQLRPQDRTAQIQLVTLYLGRMQTVDKQIAYLKDLMKRPSVPPEVRSYFAMVCAGLYWQQGKADERSKMVDEALKLNPLNVVALRAKYDLTLASGTPAERAGLLVGLLRANPQQTVVMLDLARELAGVGAVSESIQWYKRVEAFNSGAEGAATTQPSVEARDAGWQLEYAAEQFLAGDVTAARGRLDAILEKSPDYYPAIVLRYLVEKQQNGAKKDQLRMQARNVLIVHLDLAQETLRSSATSRPATTRPSVKVDERPLAMPDVAADVKAFAASKNERIQDYYLSALDDLTWFEVFFDNNPAEAQKLLDHRIALTEKRHVAASSEEQKAWSKGSRIFEARVQGWIYLAQGKAKEAEVKLSAAAADDPLAALGLVRAYGPDQRAKAKAAAQKLLEEHPAGMLGALIYAEVGPLGVKVGPTAQAPAVKAVVAKFPLEWLDAPRNPGKFMSFRCDAVVRRPLLFGEPVLVRATLSNTGQYELTIGGDGLIPAGMIFDVGTLGVEPRRFPNVAVGVLREQMILKPGQSSSTVVRLDQGAFAKYLDENPLPMIQLGARVMPFGINSESMIRDAFPLRLIKVAEDAIAAGGNHSERERMRNLDLLAAIRTFVQKDPAALEKDIADSKIAADPNPLIRGWAMYVLASNVEGKRAGTAEAMLKDAAWQVRLLGIAAAEKLPAEQCKSLLADIAAKDPEATVKDYAKGAIEQADRPPTTRPAAGSAD